MNVIALGLATWPSLNLSERLQLSSNNDNNHYRSQLMLRGQFIKLSVNGVSTIWGLVSTVIEQRFGHCYAKLTFCQGLLAKETAKRSPPHSEN
jgi:hypothetical protein